MLRFMEHGRNHDQRQSQLGPPRANNTPPDEPETDLEAALLHAGRGSAVLREHEPTSGGSECAPTRQAEERERVRHQLERELGRTPAGEEGLLRDAREPGVTREALDEAAQEADRRIAGHEIRKGSAKP